MKTKLVILNAVIFPLLTSCASSWVKLDNSPATSAEIKKAKEICGDVDAKLEKLDREKEEYIEFIATQNPEVVIDHVLGTTENQSFVNFAVKQNEARREIKQCMGRSGLKRKDNQ